MSFPEPAPGQVIGYSYLWNRNAASRRESRTVPARFSLR